MREGNVEFSRPPPGWRAYRPHVLVAVAATLSVLFLGYQVEQGTSKALESIRRSIDRSVRSSDWRRQANRIRGLADLRSSPPAGSPGRSETIGRLVIKLRVGLETDGEALVAGLPLDVAVQLKQKLAEARLELDTFWQGARGPLDRSGKGDLASVDGLTKAMHHFDEFSRRIDALAGLSGSLEFWRQEAEVAQVARLANIQVLVVACLFGGLLSMLVRMRRLEANAVARFLASQSQTLALQTSQERFEALSDALTEAFWIGLFHGETLQYVSPAYERIWGLSAEGLYRDPLSRFASIHPDDRSRVLHAVNLLPTGRSYDVTYRITRADRQVRWIRESGRIGHATTPGDIPLTLFLAHDVTGEPRAVRQAEMMAAVAGLLATKDEVPEVALQIAELAADAVEAEQLAIWMVEPVSGSLREMARWPGGLPRGAGPAGPVDTGSVHEACLRATPVMHPASREAVGATAAAEIRRGELAIPIVLGQVVVAAIEVECGEPARLLEEHGVFLGNLGLLLAQFIRCRWAEEERDRYRVLSGDLHCSAGDDGYFKSISPAWHAVLGWEPEELTSRPYQEFVHAQDRERTMLEMSQAAPGGVLGSLENRYRCRDGSYRWLAWRFTPAAQPGLLHAAAADITGRRLAEMELTKARDEAMQLAQLNSQFLQDVEQALRVPVKQTLAIASRLLEDAQGPRQREYANRLRDCARGLLHVMNNLLFFWRRPGREVQAFGGVFNLRTLLEDTLAFMAWEARESGVELIWRYSPSAPDFARADEARLRYLLVGMVRAALAWSVKGLVFCDLECLARTDQSAFFQFAVRDFASSLPAERLRGLLDVSASPVMPAAPSKSDMSGQLRLIAHLAQMMGAEVGAASSTGKGTTLSFGLKLAVEPGPGGGSGSFTPPACSRALVVDGNPLRRAVLQEQLKAWGIPTDCTESGSDALIAAQVAAGRGERFELCLIDGSCVKENPGFAARVQADPMLSQLKLLALVEPEQRAELEGLQGNGFAAVILKPVRASTLLRALGGSVPEASRPGPAAARAYSAEPDSGPPRPPGPVLEAGALDKMKALPPRDGVPFLDWAIRLFLETAQRDLLSIKQGLAAAETEAVRKAAHSLRGGCLNTGAARLANLAREIEARAREGSLQPVAALLQELDLELELVAKELESQRELRQH